MYNFNYILVCGDIHGDIGVIPHFLKEYDLKNCAIIVVGDFGIGFENQKKEIARINYLDKYLKLKDSTVFVVRGNHDDPQYFDGKFDTHHVKFIPDYTVLQFNNLWNILCVGGATSIDRTDRKPYIFGKGTGWWKDEIFVYDENKVNQLQNKIDYVITHTTPHFAYPFHKDNIQNWINKDIHLIPDLKKEREDVTKLYEHLIKNDHKIINWYYGHYHRTNKMLHMNTTFICLDINEIQEIKPFNTNVWE
jgi:predicted phosphodiesterase